jgi:hypothetical protein
MRGSLGPWLAILGLTILLFGCGGGGGRIGPPAIEEAIFADDFSEAHSKSWQLEGDSLGASRIVDGVLEIEINAPNTLQFVTLLEPVPPDFDVSVDATLVAGDPSGSYGILVRLQGSDAFYRFEVTGESRYMVERRDPDGRWTRFLDDWTYHEAIIAGTNSTNRLRVQARGDQLDFYVNGELLQEVTDGAYSAGDIALDAGTFGQPGLRVTFDNVVLLEL